MVSPEIRRRHGADPIRPAADLIDKLVAIETAWCRRLHLEADVVAYEPQADGFARVVIDIEGPGAASLLAMEEGLHRLRRGQGGDLRATVEIIPKSDQPTPAASFGQSSRNREGRWMTSPE